MKEKMEIQFSMSAIVKNLKGPFLISDYVQAAFFCFKKGK